MTMKLSVLAYNTLLAGRDGDRNRRMNAQLVPLGLHALAATRLTYPALPTLIVAAEIVAVRTTNNPIVKLSQGRLNAFST